MANKSAKGGEWERFISKKLSLWWSEGVRDDLFWRSRQSGGRATQRAKSGIHTTNAFGDICSEHPSTRGFIETFVLELKRGYSDQIKVLDVLDGTKKIPTLVEFWNQCEKDRITSGRKYNLVLFKRDRKKEMIIMRRSLFFRFMKYAGPVGEKQSIVIKVSERFNIPPLMMMRLDDWLEWLDPKVVQKLIEDLK